MMFDHSIHTYETKYSRRELLAGASTLLALSWITVPPSASAQLKVDIQGIGVNQVPLLISTFVGEQGLKQQLSTLITQDLARTGYFKFVQNPVSLGTQLEIKNQAEIRSAGADAALVGAIKMVSNERFEVEFRLLDVVQNLNLGGLSFIANPRDSSQIAHRIADYVQNKLTGIPGTAASSIAFVADGDVNRQALTPYANPVKVISAKGEATSSYRRKRLNSIIIASSSGHDQQIAVTSPEALLSPTWSVNGDKIAYVSFEGNRPSVFVHTLATGARLRLLSVQSSAPAFAPDGKSVALTVMEAGQSNIYRVNIDGSERSAVIRGNGIDTSPTFSPNGTQLYFVSDRGGPPQIYRVNLNDPSSLQRITFGVSEAYAPSISQDGKLLCFMGRTASGSYHIYVKDLQSQSLPQAISAGPYDESPSFAPNNQMVLYSSGIGEKKKLTVIALNTGRVTFVETEQIAVREPVWGGYLT